MLLATGCWPCLLQNRMCSTDVYCSKQTGSSSTKGNHHPSFLSSFLELGRRNCRDAAKICGGAERNKQKTQNIRKWIARFYYFSIYTAGSACVLFHTLVVMSCPSIWATLSALPLINTSGFLPVVFAEWISLSLRVNIRSAVITVGGRLHYPRRRRWWLHALTDRLL